MALLSHLRGVFTLGNCRRLCITSETNIWSKGARSFFTFFKKTTPTKLKEIDDVPEHFLLIYRNTMSRYLLGAQVVSVIGGGVGIFAFLLKPNKYENNPDTVIWSPSSRTKDNEETLYVAFLIAFVVLIQVFVARTPIRIYKVPQTPHYVSISYGNFFFGKSTYKFKRGQIHHLEESGFLPWRGNKYIIDKETDRKPVIVLEQFFRRSADLSIMLGEQKDPDLEE